MSNIKNKKKPLVDNSRFIFKNEDENIRNEYFDKWMRAFLVTPDPFKWLQKRNHSKKILSQY